MNGKQLWIWKMKIIVLTLAYEHRGTPQNVSQDNEQPGQNFANRLENV
jgi:hypothetical protein